MWPALLAALPGLASAAGGLFGMFGKNKNQNPADAANNQLNQIPGQVSPYYQPYMTAGQGALGNLQSEYGQALNDPNSIYNKLGGGYKESPGYQFKLQQALGAGQNASASGGMLGTPQDVQNQTQIGHDIADQDFEKYMQNMFGIYNQGLQGEQGLNQMGYDASSSMGNLIGSIGGQKAQNSFTGQQGQNQAKQGNWANLFGGLSAAGQGSNQPQQLMDWLMKQGVK